MPTKPLIHFAHANGIPSKTYSYLFELLSDEFDVVFIPQLGTDPRYPVDNHWQALTQQVIDSIKQNLAERGQSQVIGLGHSLGALCTLQASYREPQLFSQVITLDPPLIHGHYAMALHWAKRFSPSLVDRLTPAGLSNRRRDTWDSREQAYAHLHHKAFYKNFDERCFADFIQYGLTDTADGKVTLTIPKAAEVAVFRTNPSLFWRKPNHPPMMPTKQIIGHDSLFMKRGFPQLVKKRMGIDFEVHKGGHMFPLEHPVSTVNRIKALIKERIYSE
ncbi:MULTISPECIES: alpha/beta fold hydrolase [unclassified Moraxella]|uniref:alpha/beta fold hydrolase n=1 Tax=unclassified Moraxella TaxID=2685852 RepID=UPI003AF53C16